MSPAPANHMPHCGDLTIGQVKELRAQGHSIHTIATAARVQEETVRSFCSRYRIVTSWGGARFRGKGVATGGTSVMRRAGKIVVSFRVLVMGAALLLAGCGSGGKSAPAPEQLWPDGIYRVSAGGYVAHFSIAGPDVAVNGTDVPTTMERHQNVPPRWEQVGTHGGVTFGISARLRIRLTHDGRSVVVTAQRVSSNG